MQLPKWKYGLLGLLLIPCWVIAVKYEIDLVNLYAVAKLTQTEITKVYAQNGPLGRYFYGPFSLWLFQPLAGFSFETVKYFWIAVQTVCFGAFWWGLHRLYPGLVLSRLGWILVFVMAINPIHNNFQSNNIQLMLAAALLVAEVWTHFHKKSFDFGAGLLVALASAVKVFPLFIAAYYLLVRGLWVRLGILLGLALSVVIPFLAYGPENALILHRDFLSNLTTYNVENSFTKVPDILCLPSLLSRWLSHWETPPGTWTPLIVKLSILGISGLFFLSVLQWKKEKNWINSRTQVHTWALANALMALLNPSTRPHYFIFYIPAVASLVEVLEDRVPAKLALTLKVFLGLSVLLIAFTAQGVTGKTLNDQLEFLSLPTFGAAFLTLAIVLLLKASRKLSTTATVS